MAKLKKYYKVTATKGGNIAADYKTADYEEALDMYIDYIKGFGDYNYFLRSLGRDETDYIITLNTVNTDNMLEEIRKMEV